MYALLAAVNVGAWVWAFLEFHHYPGLRGACEILGLDPLYVANEGKLVAIVPAGEAVRVLAAMQGHPLGQQAAIIGEVTAEHPNFVLMKTRIGGSRVVDMLSGEQLPRIC
jgi:hydrogenase expression/formation protein HypE